MRSTDDQANLRQQIDVVDFFLEVKEEYALLQRNIYRLLHTLPDYSPGKILLECQNLAMHREKLAEQDKRVFAILHMAGAEIVKTNIVNDHRSAIANALIASNALHQRLLVLKASLQQEIHAPPHAVTEG